MRDVLVLHPFEEKSLGCVCKGGTSPLVEVVDYACRPTRRGLVMMDIIPLTFVPVLSTGIVDLIY